MTVAPGGEVFGIKLIGPATIAEGDEGRVQAVVSTADEVDNDGEVVVSGAIDDGAKVTVSSYNHDTVMGQMLGTGIPDQPPVGKGVIRVQGKRAIAELQYFMSTQRGREAFNTLKEMGSDQKWSFAYRKVQVAKPTPEWEAKGARRLLVKLGPLLDGAYECSPVKMPGNSNSGTLSAKGKGVPTSSVDGIQHPAEDFAYVPDPNKPSTWKLPIFDADHVRNALARLYQTDIPSDALSAVRKRILAAAERFQVDAASLEKKSFAAFEPGMRARLRAGMERLRRAHGEPAVPEPKRALAARALNFFAKRQGLSGPRPTVEFFAPDGDRHGEFIPPTKAAGIGRILVASDLEGTELVETVLHEAAHCKFCNQGHVDRLERAVELMTERLLKLWREENGSEG